MSRVAVVIVAFVASVSVLLSHARQAVAQAAPEASARSDESPQCYPTCRAGFVCHRGQCVSECNPPCPAGQTYVEGRSCEASPPGAYEPPAPGAPGAGGVYEPPPPPPPPNFARRTHSALAFHMGLGGGVKKAGTRDDLVSTLGVNLRTDIPVAEYMLLGPLFQFGAWRPDVPDPPDRNFYFDIDFFLRARVPVQADSTAFQVWLGIPIGLTLDFLSEAYDPELDGFAFGWNYGFLVGGAVHFSKKFGMFAEVGWMRHSASHDRLNASGSVHIEISQTVANFGFMFGA